MQKLTDVLSGMPDIGAHSIGVLPSLMIAAIITLAVVGSTLDSLRRKPDTSYER